MILALVYLAVVFGLDYLSTGQGVDAAAVALSVITFPSGLVTTIVFLLLAVDFGSDDYTAATGGYEPSGHVIAGVVQVVLVWAVLRAVKKRRERKETEIHL